MSAQQAAVAQLNTNSTADQLLPLIGGALVEVGQKNWELAIKEMQQFSRIWEVIPVTSNLNQSVATKVSTVMKAIKNKDQVQAEESLSVLVTEVNTYVDSTQVKKAQPSGKETGKKLLSLVEKTYDSLQQGHLSTAQSHYRTIVGGWKKIEMPIRKDHFSVYSQLETKMTMIRISLQANPPRQEQAKQQLSQLLR